LQQVKFAILLALMVATIWAPSCATTNVRKPDTSHKRITPEQTSRYPRTRTTKPPVEKPTPEREPETDETEPSETATVSESASSQPTESLARQEGIASWYGDDWHGKATASGERFNKRLLTAAHLTFRMGSIVRVTNTKNLKSVTVRINDRGPYDKKGRRIIDVSEAAAKILDMIDAGLCPVTLELLSEPPPKMRKKK
jgi:rare lipoprotein A